MAIRRSVINVSTPGRAPREPAAQKSPLPVPGNRVGAAALGFGRQLVAIGDRMKASSDDLTISQYQAEYDVAMAGFTLGLHPDNYAAWPEQIGNQAAILKNDALEKARRAGVSPAALNKFGASLESSSSQYQIAGMKSARRAEATFTGSRLDNLQKELAQVAQGKGPESPEVMKAKEQYGAALDRAGEILPKTDIFARRHAFNVKLEEEWLSALVEKSPHILMQLPDDAFRFTMKRDEYQAKARISLNREMGGYFNSSNNGPTIKQRALGEVNKAQNAVEKSMLQALNLRSPEVFTNGQGKVDTEGYREHINATIDNMSVTFSALRAAYEAHGSNLTPTKSNAIQGILDKQSNVLFVVEQQALVYSAADLESLDEIEQNWNTSLGAKGEEGARYRGQELLFKFAPDFRRIVKDRRDELTIIEEWNEVEANPSFYDLPERQRRARKMMGRYGGIVAARITDSNGNIDARPVQDLVNLAQLTRYIPDEVVNTIVSGILDRNREEDNRRGSLIRIASLLKIAGDHPDIDEMLKPVQDYLIDPMSMKRNSMDIGRDVGDRIEREAGTSVSDEELTKKFEYLESILEENKDWLWAKLPWAKEGDTTIQSIGRELVGATAQLWGTRKITENVRGDLGRLKSDLQFYTQTALRDNPKLSVEDAYKRGLETVKNAWKISWITGKPRLMLNPPNSSRFNFGGVEATTEQQRDLINSVRAFFNSNKGIWSESTRKAINKLWMKPPRATEEGGPSSMLDEVKIVFGGWGGDEKPRWRVRFYNKDIGFWRPLERDAAAHRSDIAIAKTIRAGSDAATFLTTSKYPTRYGWFTDMIAEVSGAPVDAPIEHLLGTDFPDEEGKKESGGIETRLPEGQRDSYTPPELPISDAKRTYNEAAAKNPFRPEGNGYDKDLLKVALEYVEERIISGKTHGSNPYLRPTSGKDKGHGPSAVAIGDLIGAGLLDHNQLLEAGVPIGGSILLKGKKHETAYKEQRAVAALGMKYERMNVPGLGDRYVAVRPAVNMDEIRSSGEVQDSQGTSSRNNISSSVKPPDRRAWVLESDSPESWVFKRELESDDWFDAATTVVSDLLDKRERFITQSINEPVISFVTDLAKATAEKSLLRQAPGFVRKMAESNIEALEQTDAFINAAIENISSVISNTRKAIGDSYREHNIVGNKFIKENIDQPVASFVRKMAESKVEALEQVDDFVRGMAESNVKALEQTDAFINNAIENISSIISNTRKDIGDSYREYDRVGNEAIDNAIESVSTLIYGEEVSVEEVDREFTPDVVKRDLQLLLDLLVPAGSPDKKGRAKYLDALRRNSIKYAPHWMPAPDLAESKDLTLHENRHLDKREAAGSEIFRLYVYKYIGAAAFQKHPDELRALERADDWTEGNQMQSRLK